MVCRHTIIIQANVDISTEIAIRTNPTPSLLSASLLDRPRGSLISVQRARQALTLRPCLTKGQTYQKISYGPTSNYLGVE